MKDNPFVVEDMDTDVADLFISPDETYVYIIFVDNGWRRCTEFGELLGKI